MKNFEAQAFRVFLDWLALSLNASFRNQTDLEQRSQCMCTPHVIRQVRCALCASAAASSERIFGVQELLKRGDEWQGRCIAPAMPMFRR